VEGSQDLVLALQPVVLLLALGVVAAVASRAVGASPIVGYLALGLALRTGGQGMVGDSGTVAVLAELGVVFLLFDIGLHFSLTHVREQARDIFGFGPVQVLFGTLGLGGLAWLAGLSPLAAGLVGATLALSSTAVVAGLIAERHQQNCPVGLTATAILVFQDVAAILLLIVANALGGGVAAVLPAAGIAVGKAALAFGFAVLLSRLVVRPVFDLVARGRNEEVFTAVALLVGLAAGWAAGLAGLSPTLGAFLGGMIISETPYRPVVQSEIKPFRGLLLGFFFISVGLSLDPAALMRQWPAVLAVAVALVLAKVVLNAAASLVFRWSVPGSTQLGFLLAQGSEFAFVVLALPPVRQMIGQAETSVLVAAVVLSLAATPALAEAGRTLAGRLRRRRQTAPQELQPRDLAVPVLVVGMGTVGRTLADALIEFGIGYTAIERDQRRLAEAVADGYAAVFGDAGDPRIWEPVGFQGGRISILTAPTFAVSSALTPVARQFYPGLKRIAVVRNEADGARFREAGLQAIVDRGVPQGIDAAAIVLVELGIEPATIAAWAAGQGARAISLAAPEGIPA